MEMPRGLVLLKKLRSGEKVVCHKCGKGIILPVGDYKTTKVFYCDSCDYILVLD